MYLPNSAIVSKLQRILEEDLGEGDVTTSLTVPEETVVDAEFIVKENGIVAGIEDTSAFLESLGIRVSCSIVDGQAVRKGQRIMNIAGDARMVLCVERTVLNIISRMSGIASATKILVDKLRHAGLKTVVSCTRKTAPGLAYFDKKAVVAGGGDPHRFHLDDMILIKDNHIAVAGNLKKAIEDARRKGSFTKKIEVEVDNPHQALTTAQQGVDIIMLDNFKPKEISKAIALLKRNRIRDKILLEASGGITTDTILEYGSTGVDIVSLGEITQDTKALDVSLEIVRITKEK